MTRRLTLLFAAFEAVLVAGIGVAIPLVPLTILWAVQYGFAPDWLIVWRIAVDSWLVGHGVDITVLLDPKLAAALGQTAGEPLRITIAALGFGLLTLLLGARAGRRIAETGHRLLGTATAAIVFAALSEALALSALRSDARVSLWQSALLPTLAFLVGIGCSVVASEIDDAVDGLPEGRRSLRRWIAGWRVRTRGVVGAILRTGLGAVAIIGIAASVLLTLLIVTHYVEMIRLYESLGGDWAGGLALTVGQLALLPDAVVWTMSWLVGPGFAIGAGSAVSPLGTALGPLPAIPLLGAVPTGSPAFGFAGLVVPVAAGFLAAVGARRSLRRALGDAPAGRWMALVALGGGLLAGVVVGLLSWVAAGSAGPGRLSEVGPDPWSVGLWAAIECAVAIGIGLAFGGIGRGDADDRIREAEPVRAAAPPAEPAQPALRRRIADLVPGRRAHAERTPDARPEPDRGLAEDDVDTAPVPTIPARRGR